MTIGDFGFKNVYTNLRGILLIFLVASSLGGMRYAEAIQLLAHKYSNTMFEIYNHVSLYWFF